MTKRPKSGKHKTIFEPSIGTEFTVTTENVRGSVVADPENCAAAKACAQLDGIEHAWVYRTRTILLRDDGSYVRYKNPASLTRTVEGYDASAGVFPPGTYKLNPINRGSRAERRAQLNAKNPKRQNRGIRPHRQPKERPNHVIR